MSDDDEEEEKKKKESGNRPTHPQNPYYPSPGGMGFNPMGRRRKPPPRDEPDEPDEPGEPGEPIKPKNSGPVGNGGAEAKPEPRKRVYSDSELTDLAQRVVRLLKIR